MTEACHRGIRSRWIEFPALIRDLLDKSKKSKDAYESRLKYYTRFRLLCIDEFLTPDDELTVGIKETEILKELMMALEKTDNSLMVTMQCNHKQMGKLLFPEMSGQAIQGRLCQHAMVIDLSRGVDLRMYEPTDYDLNN